MKLTVTMQLDATLGENVNPSEVTEIVRNAIIHTIRDASWLHLPGSRHKPQEKISLVVQAIEVKT